MASYPRREKAELKARERAAALVPALDCQSCGAITSGDRYICERIVCETCSEQNPRARRRMVPRAWLQPRDIHMNFLPRDGYSVQAMDLDCRTMLGPHVHVPSKETLRRLLVYLGATAEQLADFDQCVRSWGQGTAKIKVQPGRKNLLRLRHLV
jgi:hypothetical protein